MNDEHETGYEPRDDNEFITEFGKGILIGGLFILCALALLLLLYDKFLKHYLT